MTKQDTKEVREPVEKTVKQFTKYTFSEKEKAEIAQDMAARYLEISNHEAELKAAKSQITSKIDSSKAVVNSCSLKLKDGYEMKTMDCKQVFDYEKKTVTVYHPQTNEEIESREMTKSELQLELFPDN